MAIVDRSLGPEHAVIRGLREPRSETQLTRTLATVFGADEALAAAFVRSLVLVSKRRDGPAWAELPERLGCRGEVDTAQGRVDLEFVDASGEWLILVELKIDAGYGHNQIERYLQTLDVANPKHVLAAITRD